MTQTITYPRQVEAIEQQVANGRITWTWPVILTVIRLPLFGLVQLLIAGLFWLLGRNQAWEQSIAWWPLVAVAVNLICIWLLYWRLDTEGFRLRDLYRLARQHLKQDLLVMAGLLLIIGPIGFLPNVLMANLLWGDPMMGQEMFIRPLPLWAAWLGLILFPLTIALAELPLYFGYALPRLTALSGRWKAILFTAFWLGAQHCTLPLIFDGRFLLWRLVMFIPFALAIGLVLHWRPRLLPYFMIIHWLIDLPVAWMVLSMSLP